MAQKSHRQRNKVKKRVNVTTPQKLVFGIPGKILRQNLGEVLH